MAELVTIPISVFEITIDYEQPALKIWADRAAVVQGIFDALSPWKPNVDDIEPRTTGKLSEQGVNFRLPLKRMAFFFGPASCSFVQDGADWQSSEETIVILSTLLSALTQLGGVILGTRKTFISIHLQPRTLHFLELLRPLVPPQFGELESTPIKTMAIVGKWEKRKVTIDGSGSLANGLFMRFEREFNESTSFEEMAHQLRQDEEGLFKMLGIEEDLG
jgi:hypothetical protein